MGYTDRYASQLSAAIKREREARKWSQAHLARLLARKGISPSLATTVAKTESGARSVRVDELVAYAEVFGVSIEALLGCSPDPANDLAFELNRLEQDLAGAGQVEQIAVNVMISALALEEYDFAKLDLSENAGLPDNLVRLAEGLNQVAAAMNSTRETCKKISMRLFFLQAQSNPAQGGMG